MKALVGFAGFGGPEIALRDIFIESVGIEKDNAIAEVNRWNGGNCLTADLLDIDPAGFAGWWLYHFSPPCPRFSLARNSKVLQSLQIGILDLARHQRVVNGEADEDLRLARKICEFIKIGRPQFFTLENVWGYRKSQSWLLIWYTLREEGYGVEAWNLNAADYGVPQSRRRMIVIGRRDGRQPAKPWPTHSRKPDMFTRPWVGWYEAIKDLIPTLPETKFAAWQIAAMPEEPTFAIISQSNQTGVKAFVINSQNANVKRNLTLRNNNQPMFTVTANAFEKHSPPKAFIVDCQYSNFGDQRGLIVRQQGQPIFTMTASANRRTIRTGLDSGKVVSMTARALARFQDFPDSYILPDESGLDENIVLKLDSRTGRELACRGIGNALPPGMYRAILRSLNL